MLAKALTEREGSSQPFRHRPCTCGPISKTRRRRRADGLRRGRL